ncbi:hypothetical protein SCHPADRAFT_138915 [Schizopora paradoxa]|uniref:DUF6533 domain-containing protein n=1 Tax=Schizopora paradoxa TaxID=27342 RepID=A0A0H2S1S3_9AGAM|nr:hypothetical protein SCHPADRAFT_138915 [Schizopora paradoxa]
MITIPDEVQFIWSRRLNFVSLLYFVNRYYALFALGVTVLQLTLPVFTAEVCQKSFLFPPLATGIVLMFSPNIAIGVRVFALYNMSKRLGAFIVIYLSAELGVALWIYLSPGHHPTVLPGPPDTFNNWTLHSCGFSPSPSLNNFQAAAYQLMQSGYDSTMFLLIICKTFSEAFRCRTWSSSSLRYCIARDGLWYYMIVFSCNLTWALMTIFAPSQIKNIAAEPTVHLSCIAVNRLTFNVRRFGSDLSGTTQLDSRRTGRQPLSNSDSLQTINHVYNSDHQDDLNEIPLSFVTERSSTKSDYASSD